MNTGSGIQNINTGGGTQHIACIIGNTMHFHRDQAEDVGQAGFTIVRNFSSGAQNVYARPGIQIIAAGGSSQHDEHSIQISAPPNEPTSVLPRRELSDLTSDCLAKLWFAGIDDRTDGIESAGTCEWILDHQAYKDWTDSDRALLWIKGKAGLGKSTLMDFILKNYQSRNDSLPEGLDFALFFFFQDQGNPLQKKSFELLRSLLFQILSRLPGMLRNFVTDFGTQYAAAERAGEG